jgi:hypothetical protein
MLQALEHHDPIARANHDRFTSHLLALLDDSHRSSMELIGDLWEATGNVPQLPGIAV